MSSPTPPVDGEDPTDGDLTSLGRVNRMLSRPVDQVDQDVVDVVEAVNTLVPTWRARPAGGWTPHHHYGATLLAARLYRRRDSPGGQVILGMDATGGYVQSNWPDVALLLGLGTYAVGRPG
jgi:hypothetical protein